MIPLRFVPPQIAWRLNAMRVGLDRLRDKRAASLAAQRLSPRASRILQDLKTALKGE